jgi:chromate transporter
MNPPADTARPDSLAHLFLAFNRLALQGFGGVLAVAQYELVERRRWLRKDEFLELLSAAQLLPGPNVVNLSLMLGDRFFGLRGACAALAGLLTVPLAIVLVLASLHASYADNATVAAMLRGMGVVAAALIIATALKLAGALRGSPLGGLASSLLVLATVAAVAGFRWPLFYALGLLGPAAVAWAWWKLRA